MPVSEPWEKEYDAPGNRPADWPSQFDLSNWGLFLARDGARVLGAAAVCWSTPGVDLLGGRNDLAFVWDLRGLMPTYPTRSSSSGGNGLRFEGADCASLVRRNGTWAQFCGAPCPHPRFFRTRPSASTVSV